MARLVGETGSRFPWLNLPFKVLREKARNWGVCVGISDGLLGRGEGVRGAEDMMMDDCSISNVNKVQVGTRFGVCLVARKRAD